jgi:aminoglycoside N3'-acetyltransferase
MLSDTGSIYDNAMLGRVFDYAASPSIQGLISELFRRRCGAIRSTYPNYNLTGCGRLARTFIEEHEKNPSPYAMDVTSPWFRLNEVGGKVVLLGVDFEVNSTVHVVEYAHHAEFPTGCMFDKRFRMKFKNRQGGISELDVSIHPMFRKPLATTRFCEYLDGKYALYRRQSVRGVPIITFEARKQYEAIYQEMKNGVHLYSPQFWGYS